jgi:hypothetical protein
MQAAWFVQLTTTWDNKSAAGAPKKTRHTHCLRAASMVYAYNGWVVPCPAQAMYAHCAMREAHITAHTTKPHGTSTLYTLSPEPAM